MFFRCFVCDENFASRWNAIYTQNNGCPYCSGNLVSDKNRLSMLFPEIAFEWHLSKNGELTCNDVSYGSKKMAWWNCKKNHEWEARIADRTSGGSGCPKCNMSKGEKRIESFLCDLNISFVEQKRFEDCKYKSCLPFDFYLPQFNLIIEHHGIQHYEAIDFGGKGKEWAKEEFKIRKKRDKIKEKYCKNNNIQPKIIPYWDYDNIEKILTETLQLM